MKKRQVWKAWYVSMAYYFVDVTDCMFVWLAVDIQQVTYLIQEVGDSRAQVQNYCTGTELPFQLCARNRYIDWTDPKY
jgi:hypothetical protein